MQHPFINNLNEKSLEEIQKTMSDLQNKLNFAYRMAHGQLISQLLMAYDSYKQEYGKKLDELIKKQNISTKINIKKENELDT
jgi:hypothetical protein